MGRNPTEKAKSLMSNNKTTVLMYHALVEKRDSDLHPVHIEIAMFEQQMGWLHAQGYDGITVEEWYSRWSAKQLSRPAVVITFDDGYSSLMDRAAPILKKYGFAATLFLTTDFVGMPAFNAEFAQAVPPCQRPLTWAEVQTLQVAGWDIQAHSCSHRPHAALPIAQLKAELETSKQIIVNQLNNRVKFYAFPYGNYNRQALKALQDAGYWAGFAVHSGQISPTSDLRRLPRIEINADCSSSVFAKLVRTGHASTPGKYRARLRNALFYFPLVKDVMQKAFGSFVN